MYCENSYPIAVVQQRHEFLFSMPFQKKAKIELVNQHKKNKNSCIFYQIDYCLYDSLPDQFFIFHAKWNREKLTQKARDC